MGRATSGVIGMDLESYSVKEGKNVTLVKDESFRLRLRARTRLC